MESTPDDRDHGYDDQVEEEAYEEHEKAADDGEKAEGADPPEDE